MIAVCVLAESLLEFSVGINCLGFRAGGRNWIGYCATHVSTNEYLFKRLTWRGDNLVPLPQHLPHIISL